MQALGHVLREYRKKNNATSELSKTRCTPKKNLENVHLETTSKAYGFYGIREF